MKQLLINSFWILLLCSVSACKQQSNELTSSTRYKYENILKIDYTPDTASRCGGWFSDQGSWMGFTIPAHEKWINGFCGPFDFDNREWMAKSLVEVGFENPSIFVPDSTSYFPGELYLSATSPIGQISQRLIFVDKSTALLSCATNKNKPLRFYSAELSKEVSTLSIEQNSCIVSLKDGRILVATFAPETKLKKTEQGGYQ
ncbi:MAG: glycoside hydrolase, partial [Bacteroidaceae bacterium]